MTRKSYDGRQPFTSVQKKNKNRISCMSDVSTGFTSVKVEPPQIYNITYTVSLYLE